MRKSSKALGLWMNGLFVGTWRVEAGVDVLQYDPQWVAHRLGRPLSLSLPFTPGNRPHTGDTVRFYFENLLPDHKEIRERIARRYRLGRSDAYALLREVGRDCVGALQILPLDEAPPTDLRVQYASMTEAQVAAHVRSVTFSGPTGVAQADDTAFRISIAGAQEKTALLHWRGQWCMPLGATPTTHIFKLPLGVIANQRIDMRDSVENEWLCAQILAAYGMPVAACDMLTFEDQKVLSVQRFDRRIWQGDRLMRLPQEDMCQALGVSPLQKYETDGGPGIDPIMQLLDGSQQRELDRYRFFMAQLLFWMLAAVDGHAKNFSLFIKPGGAYAMTPLYDVLSVYPVMGRGTGRLAPQRAQLAMAIRGKNAHRKLQQILRRHWVALGARYGVASPKGMEVEALLAQVVAHTPSVIAQVQEKLPAGFPGAVADPIFTGLARAAQRLAQAVD